MTDRLGHKQTAAMLTLMVLAREVANPELRDIVGFAIDGVVRRDLTDAGFVSGRKQGRAFAHTLTDRGREWCREELSAGTVPPPSPRSSLASALYVLLGSLDGYLTREHLRLTDVFVPAVEWTPEQIEVRIRDAYRTLAHSPRDWVRLAELRPMLDGAPASDVDTVLKQLSGTAQAHLSPLSNRKLLTDADHAAAVRLGGEDNHRLLIEAS
ncbi:MAG TPA: hypothetical protein VGG05_03765 [Pseudonocardiaceae bacterium]|jgi:hypothetical protein